MLLKKSWRHAHLILKGAKDIVDSRRFRHLSLFTVLNSIKPVLLKTLDEWVILMYRYAHLLFSNEMLCKIADMLLNQHVYLELMCVHIHLMLWKNATGNQFIGRKFMLTQAARWRIRSQWYVGSSTEHHGRAKLLTPWQPERREEEIGSNRGRVQGQSTPLKDMLSRVYLLQFVLLPRLLSLLHNQFVYEVSNALTHWWSQAS